jgi:DinB superfamily
MNSADVLVDALGRVHAVIHGTVEGLDQRALTFRPDQSANTIAWLVWHLTRIQDDHIAGVAGSGQVWMTEGWNERFGLPFDPRDTGFGHGVEDVAAVDVEADLLLGYLDAVHERSVEYVSTLTDQDLDEVVDANWDPPVTLGVRLVSVVNDDIQHAGQASFVRGIAERSM